MPPALRSYRVEADGPPGPRSAAMSLRRAFSLDFPAGGSVLFIHWRGGSRAARRAGDFFFDGMTAALAAASARYGVSVAERLATDGRGGSAACFLSGFSGWRVGTLYPLAGWQPRRAAGRRFLFDGMTAALAAASARYGVSVAERLATDGRGGSAACFLSGFSGWRVGTLYPLAGWQPRRAAGRRFLFDGMTAALAAASARYGVSVAERLATDGRGGLCGVLSLWIFRLAGRYSLSIGGVAAAPRGGPAISF